jgi:hypothetical protein
MSRLLKTFALLQLLPPPSLLPTWIRRSHVQHILYHTHHPAMARRRQASSPFPILNTDTFNTGANAWQLTAASLVALQSVPGLVVMYAGIMKGKWAINSAFMAFYAFAAVLITWVVWAYKMGFGEQWIPICGIPGPIISMNDLLKQAELPTAGVLPNFPMSTMVYFQFVFAAITLVIMVRTILALGARVPMHNGDPGLVPLLP